jgi:hypothetical protein
VSKINYDIAISGNDLVFSAGDFVIGGSDTQHVADTINAFPGWWKENPADGVGVFQFINSTGQEQRLRRAIQIQLQSDNYTALPIISTDISGTMNINPNVQ